ncbi:MAG TPA: sigma-70 family RNA polymerase sigma factor [Candidatus Angelobacter sp.]|nr:sigma-70 family RNA polymerase sigma factor [Candidatus Angelobacter sp.]
MSFGFRSKSRSCRDCAPLANEQKSLIGFPSSDIESLSDEDLVELLVLGTHDALRVLFERYSQMVFGMARRALKDDGEAEETMQQVFFDIYRAANLFDREKGSFKVWIIRYAYTRMLNRKKHLAAKGFYTAEELTDEILPVALYEGAGRSLQMSPSEFAHLIEQLLNTIQPRQRQAIELTFFFGLTAEEVAAQTGETPSVVRHNLYRGLSKLRIALTEHEQIRKKQKVKNVREGALLAYPESL